MLRGAAVAQGGLQRCSVSQTGSGSWGLVQLSSLHPGGGGAEASWGECRPLGLVEELRSSPSSFPGSLLQSSGALMLCLAHARILPAPGLRSHLQLIPAMPRKSRLTPLPSSSAHALVLPAAPVPDPFPSTHGPSHAKPLRSQHTGAVNPSPRASHSQVSAALGGQAPSVWLWPGDTLSVHPHAGGTLCMG